MRFAQEVPKPQTEESASEDTDHKPTELEQMMEKSCTVRCTVICTVTLLVTRYIWGKTVKEWILAEFNM